MTQEEKSLLLQDICARLPYGVTIQVYYEDISGSGYFDETVWSVDNDEPFHVNDRLIENIKPYLRPMSSMTEEEKDEMHRMLSPEGTALYRNDGIAIPMNHFGDFVPYEYMSRIIDWLNKNMFDYRGLIEKGLALEATEGMYK